MKTLLALFFLCSPAWGAIGDKLQGTWTGAGNLDEFVLEWPGGSNARRQANVACRNVKAVVSTANNRLKVDLTFNCGPGLASGTSNFDHELRNVGGKPYREVFDAGSPDVVVGRLFDDGLDLVEHNVDAGAGDMIAVLMTLSGTRNVRFRLNWSSIGAPVDSLAKYLTAPLRK